MFEYALVENRANAVDPTLKSVIISSSLTTKLVLTVEHFKLTVRSYNFSTRQ
jgi:hypothetical protein